MKKNKIALLLVLIVVLADPVFSNQDGCEFTAEFLLGSIGARKETNPLPWGVGSFVSICLPVAIVAVLAADPWYFYDWDEQRNWAVFGAVIGTIVSLSIPLIIKPPQPAVIPDRISEENLDCYIDGYTWRARRTRIRGVLIGSIPGWAVALTFIGTWFFVDACA